MAEKEKNDEVRPKEMLETALGPVETGLPEIPEPSTWPSTYGVEEAVAIAVVPERALIFWEYPGFVSQGKEKEFKLVRLHLAGDTPLREDSWAVGASGRFQDGGLTPGEQYIYVISLMREGEEIPVLVTNPITMPPRHLGEVVETPSSIEIVRMRIERALRGVTKK